MSKIAIPKEVMDAMWAGLGVLCLETERDLKVYEGTDAEVFFREQIRKVRAAQNFMWLNVTAVGARHG